MLYLINPAGERPMRKKKLTEAVKRGRRGLRRSAPKKKRRRFSAKQIANQRRFAAAARARAKTAKRSKRAKGATMAKRKATRRRTVSKRRRVTGTMKSVRRVGGASVSRKSWRSAGYRRNPKRRRYRRNPGMAGGLVGGAIELTKNTGAALVGAAVGRTVSNFIPISGGPVVNFAKSTAVAIAIRMLGARFVGQETARFAAVGAMLGPLKDLILSFAPQAAPFLSGDGVMYLPGIPAGMPQFSAYAEGGEGSYQDEAMGAYAAGGF